MTETSCTCHRAGPDRVDPACPFHGNALPARPDMVNHPPHYNADAPQCPNCGYPIECIVIVRRMTFNVGNAVKYLWRAGKKGDLKKAVEDLRKAAWYCHDEADRIEREEGLGGPNPPDEQSSVQSRVTPRTREWCRRLAHLGRGVST